MKQYNCFFLPWCIWKTYVNTAMGAIKAPAQPVKDIVFKSGIPFARLDVKGLNVLQQSELFGAMRSRTSLIHRS